MSERTLNESGVDALPEERSSTSVAVVRLLDDIVLLQRENEKLRKFLYIIFSASTDIESSRLALEAISGMEVTDVTE